MTTLTFFLVLPFAIVGLYISAVFITALVTQFMRYLYRT